MASRLSLWPASGIDVAQLKLRYVNSYYNAQLKLVHVFRRKGHKCVTIQGRPGEPEFMAQYAALLESTNTIPKLDRDDPGSVDAVIKCYLVDPSFTENLSEATQNMRRPILKRFQEFKTPSGFRYGEAPIAELPNKQQRIKDVLKGLTPAAQKNFLKTLRGFIVYAVAKDHIKIDPTIGIRADKPPRKSLGHMTWGDEQIDQYRERHAVGTVARAALELALNIAARRYDVHQIGRPQLKDGKLVWRPNKTARTTGKTLTVGVLPELREAIEALPKNDSLIFLTTDYGRPFKSAAAFGNKFADWCRAAGLRPIRCDDGRVRSFRIHGLRKASLTRLALDGCTGPELLAISGHSSLAQVEPYIQAASQIRLAEAALRKRLASNRRQKKSKPEVV
jgi:integrase/recombinase XerD